MLSSNPICPVCNYATSAVYCDLPTPEQLVNGVKPLDSLPAAWWNKMWNMINCSVNQARGAVGSFITELNNVLAGAGICPNCVCTDQLYRAIDLIRQTIGNATVAGAVKSSTTPGMVSIDENGFMTANCVGNATQLATSARTLVGAVNELKTTYDTCFGNVSTTLDGKAPTSHASSATTYGVGTAANYGHLRISDTYTSNLSDTGMAASQTALYCVYKYAEQIASSATGLGNTVGCSLGTAAAGTATTAARSDHVHPLPECVCRADWAICARCVCHVACANAHLYHVSLSSLASNNMSYVYVSCACPLTYCNTTGTLTAAQFCGNVCGNATCAYTVIDYCNPTSPIQVAYSGPGLTAAQVTHFAAFSTNLESGKTIIKDASRDTVKQVLGLGSAAYCDADALCVACATNAGTATNATCAYNIMDYCDSTRPLQIAYHGATLKCSQVSSLAAYSTNLESGKIIIKDVERGTIQVWLGLGSAAYHDADALCVACATCADRALCAGQVASFGNVTAAKNPTMRTWSVYALCSGFVTSAPECDIVKAICCVTNNFSQGSHMTVSGYMGACTIICEIRKVTDGIAVWLRRNDSIVGWYNLCATCTRSWCLPISFGGSY